MTVVEYDGRIVVVDCGLRFPTAEMLGHRPRAARLHVPARARRRHRGDRHHPRPRGPPRRAAVGPARARPGRASRSSTAASSRSRWRAPSSTSTSCATPSSRCCRPARSCEAGPFEHRARPPDALDPRRGRRRADDRARDDAHHRRLQVRPDAGRRRARPTCRASPSSAARACCCCAGDSTNADRPGWSPSASRSSGPNLERVFARCKGRIVVTSFASNIHRVQQVIDAAAAARPQGRARRALDAQERQHRPLARPHRRARGDAHPAARDRPARPTTSS